MNYVDVRRTGGSSIRSGSSWGSINNYLDEASEEVVSTSKTQPTELVEKLSYNYVDSWVSKTSVQEIRAEFSDCRLGIDARGDHLNDEPTTLEDSTEDEDLCSISARAPRRASPITTSITRAVIPNDNVVSKVLTKIGEVEVVKQQVEKITSNNKNIPEKNAVKLVKQNFRGIAFSSAGNPSGDSFHNGHSLNTNSNHQGTHNNEGGGGDKLISGKLRTNSYKPCIEENGRGRGGERWRSRGNARGRGRGHEVRPGYYGEDTIVGYVPPDLLDGDAKYEEQIQIRSGSGINFNAYEDIPVTVKGNNVPASVERFEDLKLKSVLLKSIEILNYKKPTPIQKHATPILMYGRDVLACAETGSGKTAAFVLPILHVLMGKKLTPANVFPATPEALILTPTRELASQIGKETHVYAGDSSIKTLVMYGGTSLFAQRNKILDGVNILVTTPGRLRQFLGDEQVVLGNVKYFILDEADRMLDLGFMPDIRAIVGTMCPKFDRVNGMFSATFPGRIREMADEFLNNHVFVSIGIVGGACQDVVQEFELVEGINSFQKKFAKLMEISQGMQDDEKTVVFCNTRKGTDFLATLLSMRGISSTSIHGDRFQKQREEALAEFRAGIRKILVTTPVSARGIDIPIVSLVVNFDLPTSRDEYFYQIGNELDVFSKQGEFVIAREEERKTHPLGQLGRNDEFWVWKAVDEYVHRIGRTGRVGNPGKALSFFEPEKHSNLTKAFIKVLEDAKQNIPDWMREISAGTRLPVQNSEEFNANSNVALSDDDCDW